MEETFKKATLLYAALRAGKRKTIVMLTLDLLTIAAKLLPEDEVRVMMGAPGASGRAMADRSDAALADELEACCKMVHGPGGAALTILLPILMEVLMRFLKR